MNPYRALFAALNDAGIRYLVVGGFAVNLHGYSRFTGDLDILLALDHDNLDRMGSLMDTQGFSQRLPIDVRLLSDQEQVQQLLESNEVTSYSFIAGDQTFCNVHILLDASRHFAELNERAVRIDIENELTIPVISTEDLLSTKRQSRSPQDRFDVAALLPDDGEASRLGLDLYYLQRCRQSTPGARIAWLAAAQEFVRGVEEAKKKNRARVS